MYQTLIFGLCFVALVFAARSTKRSYINENMYVRYGDIFELNPKFSRRRNLIVGQSRLWENGVVPFVLTEELEEHRREIYDAMDHISNRTCIRFRPKIEHDLGYIIIHKGDSCASFVGRLNAPVPVSLGDGCEKFLVAIHELMHSLGVHHTQSRSDRDDYIRVHYDNIQESFKNNFKKLDESENQLLVPFDFNSIMLYGPNVGSKNNEPTMTANNPKQVLLDTHEKPGLSELDIEALNKLYNCKSF